MFKKILIFLLAVSFLLEAYITYLCFFEPAKAVGSMNETYTPQYEFPIYIIGWCLLLVTFLLAWLIWAVVNNKAGFKPIVYIMGIWWIGIGIGIYAFNGTETNLLSDSLKGLLLVSVNYLYKFNV